MTKNRMFRLSALIVSQILGAALLLTGCQHRSAEKVSGLSGRYSLASVDGLPLPAKVKHGNADLEVRSGWFEFEPTGTCRTQTVFVPPSGKEVKREVSADYSVEGEKVAMKWKGAGRTAGTLQGGTFTMNNEGMIFVYRK